eukprot:3941800-Rhodomonas_salina.2
MMSSTDRAYRPTECAVLTWHTALPEKERLAKEVERITAERMMLSPYALAMRYAMSGTRIPHGDLVLLSLLCRCAMTGTDLAYPPVVLRARYAMSGTDVAYGATSARGGGKSLRHCFPSVLHGC